MGGWRRLHHTLECIILPDDPDVRMTHAASGSVASDDPFGKGACGDFPSCWVVYANAQKKNRAVSYLFFLPCPATVVAWHQELVSVG